MIKYLSDIEMNDKWINSRSTFSIAEQDLFLYVNQERHNTSI